MIRRTLSEDGFICRFSILTIVDWLTLARRAIAVCVSPSAFRRRGISSRSGIIGPPMGRGYIFLSEFSPQSDIILRVVFGTDDPMSGTRGLRRGPIPDKSDIWTRASTPHSRRGNAVARNIIVEEPVQPAIPAAYDYLTESSTNLNVDADVILDCKIGHGSVDLRGLYDTQKQLANDTSFGVGFAPFSELETVTLKTEQLINGALKKDLKEVGQDIKVMGVRHKDDIRLTVAAAFVDKYVPDKDDYRSAKEELRERLLDNAVKYTDRSVKVDINTGDNLDSEIYYLTVTGLSWENGDDGSVGRGNRVSGLITPYRPMSMEAAAGMNPVTHVGKLYNLLSFDIADRLVKDQTASEREVWVRIVSQIGKPIDQPQAATARIIPEKGSNLKAIEKDAAALNDEALDDLYKLTDRIVAGKVRTF